MSQQTLDGAIPVSVDRVAAIFDVTDKTVRSWIRAGLTVVKAGGKGAGNGAILDLVDVIAWFLEENALDVAKTRLAAAQADKHEMENAVRRGELADLAVAERGWTDLVMAFRAKMLGLPSKLAPGLTNVPDAAVIADRLGREIGVALTELAEGQGQRSRSAIGGDSPRPRAQKRAAAKAVNGKPMGRRRKAAQ